MALYSIIADVSNTIVKILRDNLVPDIIQKSDAIGLCSPADKGDFQVTVHLYDIALSEEVQRTGMISHSTYKQQYPPQFYTLSYMITPFLSGDVKFRSAEEHNIIGKTLQTFADNNIIRFKNGNEIEEMSVQLMKIPSEEKTRIWNVPNQAYRTSLFYKVSPVRIDSAKFRDISRVVDIEFTVKEKK